MYKTEIPQRRVVLRGATDVGCACWKPIVTPETFLLTVNSGQVNEPVIAPDDGADAVKASENF